MNEDLKTKIKFTLIGLVMTVFLIMMYNSIVWVVKNSANPNKNQDTIELSTLPVDTVKYEEVRYVNAKHFTSSGLYNLHCKMCHGNDGTGDGVIARYHADKYCPRDLSKVTKPDEEVYYVILEGTDHMPDATKPISKHVLTNNDIWMVVYHIKKFRKDQ